MMILYNLIMLFLLPLIFPYLLVMLLLYRKHRVGFLEKFSGPGEVTYSAVSPVFWVHAVSVGEVMAAVPLIRQIRSRYPASTVLLSTVTGTGRRTAEHKLPEVDRFLYFPFDFLWATERALSRVNPTVFIFLETEIWPNFLWGLKRRGIPSLLVNGRISSRSFPRYEALRPFMRKVLGYVGHFCMQTDRDVERLLRLGADPHKVTRTGNMKFDQDVGAKGEDLSRWREELGLSEDTRLIIAGSTHQGEEEEILRCYETLSRRYPDLCLLIAPRHPERFEEVEALFRSHGFSLMRKSQRQGPWTILLLDTVGELSRYYALGTFIFVGGSFVPRGGHNVLEPAAWGKGVFCGPHTDNFSEIAEMLESAGAAIRVRNGEELATQIERLIHDEEGLREMGKRAFQVVKEHRGSVEKNMEIIEKLLTEKFLTGSNGQGNLSISSVEEDRPSARVGE